MLQQHEPEYSATYAASLSEADREEWLNRLSPEQLYELKYDWTFWGRPEQRAPATLPGRNMPWTYWLYLAGRGSGKTRSGAEWIRKSVEEDGVKLMAFIAPTNADYRSVMVEGPAGILAVSRPDNMPLWESSKRLLTWPNGAMAEMFSAEKPERLRGPQHERIWADELCSWQYLQATWDMAMFGLRMGDFPQVFISTTPKPSPTLKLIMEDPATIISRGSTYDNVANLAPPFFTSIIKRYEGTRLGRQELNAEVLDDMPGALWTRSMIEATRIISFAEVQKRIGQLKRIVVGVDPSGSDDEQGSYQGIVVCGLGRDNRFYVLDDASMAESPDKWGKQVVNKRNHWGAHLIIVEANFGGQMASHVVKTVDRNAPVRIIHASRSKQARAEPIAALYEQSRVSHCGTFGALEDQMVLINHDGYQGVGSPDRLDALVWALTELAYPGKQIGVIQGVRY